jgi:hypothetical protein
VSQATPTKPAESAIRPSVRILNNMCMTYLFGEKPLTSCRILDAFVHMRRRKTRPDQRLPADAKAQVVLVMRERYSAMGTHCLAT